MATKVKDSKAVGVVESPVAEKFNNFKLKIGKVKFTIRGISPLIMHKWDEKAKKEMEQKQQKLTRSVKEARDPEAEFKAAIYKRNNGKYCFPAIALKACMVTAAKDVGIFKTDARRMFFIEDEFIDIESDEPVMRSDMVKLASGVSSISYRPEFKNWKGYFTVSYNESLIKPDQLGVLLNLAGYSVGIGDWRPERDGGFGRFQLEI